ncbi:arginine--tRNA ligase [Paenibacillus oryzae]|uniref:Arginine--tRNA ligase n=1 Tax=Paenibacillus oryzae TaxID=1844972 RepID=A0A1A5YU09_9BACL|nr:arginine--tRNA ligase [Paenibacillus oryzae]OBR69053.1 arginine--tRNA ligase [Paenibacillus oryzae]
MIREQLAEALETKLPMTRDEIIKLLEYPPNPDMGDAALPCFTLAKTMKQSPQHIAMELAEELKDSDWIAEAAGPYLNFRLNRRSHASVLLERIQNGSFGKPDIGKGERVIIDMSSPNIAKPFGIGHLRSTMIGNALYRILRETGYETISVNHLGDWGTQFGKMITAWLRWGGESTQNDTPQNANENTSIIKKYLELYVRFHDEAQSKPELEDEAREWFKRLEQGDETAHSLWLGFVEESLKEFRKLYERLGVSFDHYLGESFYNDKMEPVLEQLKEKGLLEESDGAMVVSLEEFGMPPCIMVKSNGTSIYATRDLATALYRRNEMKADTLLYVVGGEQALHFKQVFHVLGKMGFEWSSECKHIPFGLMRMEGQKMSTRRGKVLFLEDVLNEAVDRARALIQSKSPGLANADAVAEAIGVGAVVFGDLKNTRTLDVDFSLQEVLNFDGETGPYLQYTYARTASIVKKAASSFMNKEAGAPKHGSADNEIVADFSLMENNFAWNLAVTVGKYEEALVQAASRYEPSVLARYLLDLAQSFNRFYHHIKVLSGTEEEQAAKIKLVRAVGQTLGRGLNLLGLQTPEEI